MLHRQEIPYCIPEIWGGIECTINRIGDDYSDQLAATGHYSRASDIQHIAGLGIKALRYPVLWERHQPANNLTIDWSWTAAQLECIRRHGIRPIAGLLHHGSGPVYTSLQDPAFPGDFAEYARKVAECFPWIDAYTPINEPLTTARFSGLYGHWYPHRADALAFLQMLLHETKATVLAMKAIRRVNPYAQLIQTEDLAKIHSCEELAYQADFENQRRWLSFDLLCGKVDYFHPLWDYLVYTGITADQLAFFLDNPCPPDVLGLNYYYSSERYLDCQIEKYPASMHGGNGRHRYVDTEAAGLNEHTGIYQLLWEAWKRYGLPMAITEVHFNGTTQQQIDWVQSVWEKACAAREMGVGIQAVTMWALLGSVDWDSLLTRKAGHYERGAFDCGGDELQINELGQFIRLLNVNAGFKKTVS
jgi:dTDP-4-dehydrorhamnose reductase